MNATIVGGNGKVGIAGKENIKNAKDAMRKFTLIAYNR